MDYSHSDREIIIRREMRHGWSSFRFIPINPRSFSIHIGYSGEYSVYIFPKTNEMYRNTRQISYAGK